MTDRFSHLTGKPLASGLLGAVCLAALIVLLFLFGILSPNWKRKIDLDDYTLVGPAFQTADFATLKGWHQDSIGDIVDPFVRSCERLKGRAGDEPFNAFEALGPRFAQSPPFLGTVNDWREICLEAAKLRLGDYVDETAFAGAARTFFERRFTPVQILNDYAPKDGPASRGLKTADGTFTGYFEPVYSATLRRTDDFTAPALTRPSDLVSVDLGAFRPALAGQRLAGRIEGGALVPYADHAAINDGAVGGRATVIAYLRPDDLFFLQIQGSGRLTLLDDGGREILVGYDGQNGHPYFPIGRSLVARGAMTVENASMQTIRDWLENADPEDAAALREENPSYVFFRIYDNRPRTDLGPFGAGGVQLMDRRSLAVDRRYVGLGAPVFAAIDHPLINGGGGGTLMVAQDVGGAIKGPVRGDVYFGSGVAAGARAGGFNQTGALYVFVPKAAADRFFAAQSPS